MSQQQIKIEEMSDLELSEILSQVYENLAREQNNLMVIKSEISKRKSAKRQVPPQVQ
jgi:hypothetical protein